MSDLSSRSLHCPTFVPKLTVRVQPGASRDALVGRWGEDWKIAVRAPPEKGKANESARRLLAKLLDIPPSDVRLITGAASRTKTFETPLREDEASRRLASHAAPDANE